MTLLNRRSLQHTQTVCAKASDVLHTSMESAPVDLYSWQVMDLMLYGTGMYRISQAASRPLAEILCEIRWNDFHRKLRSESQNLWPLILGRSTSWVCPKTDQFWGYSTPSPLPQFGCGDPGTSSGRFRRSCSMAGRCKAAQPLPAG
jgi:hypothetical protein